MTNKEIECIEVACDDYKKAYPQLLKNWPTWTLVNTVDENGDEFEEYLYKHPFFIDKKYDSMVEAYKNEPVSFRYVLMNFLNSKLHLNLSIFKTHTDSIVGDESIEVNPETMEPVDIDKENKKEFIAEVMKEVPRKKYLKDFFDDPRSYKQFRDSVDDCLHNMNFEKIHKVMKCLNWKWCSWEDEYGNERCDSIPSTYGLRDDVLKNIREMEKWVNENPDRTEYYMSIGGFEYSMRVFEEGEVDDFENRVLFDVKFIVESFDNSI